MTKRVKFICAFLVLCLIFGAGFSEQAFSAQEQTPQAVKNEVISVPAGNVIRSVLTTPVDSAFLMQGHVITMVIAEDFYYNGKMILPSDSIIFGNVISVKRMGKKALGDELFLRFTQIVTPTGVQIPIAALLKTKDGKGLLYGNDDYFDGEDGHVVADVGTPFDLFLTQPITVNPEVYNSNY